ncbi:hypothetical protein Vadar_023748 [Vaccinium darrowii]|uniref:Uncharacterized protein n=1 Tax=Vaccinium darrowii TaxID=229202 RepID=A0ACB7YFP8_9ERIC|nr:hypothetical protein Vadar_023748 [Vaccinium darrowii]
MWATSGECLEVIANAWASKHNGSAMFKLTQSLRRCRTNLKNWSKSTFGNTRIKIQELSGKLSDIQALPHSSETFEIQNAISRELELTNQREEMYLHQRSLVNWLNYGDKNVAFFHATVTKQRQRNQMCRIKDELGVWLSDDSSINRNLHSYFVNLFQASGGRDYAEALVGVEAKVSDDVNRMLIREVIDSSPPRKYAIDLINKMAWTTWFIWKGRNDFVFNHLSPDRLSTVLAVAHARSEFASSVFYPKLILEVVPRLANSAWRKQSVGSLKINCDAAFSNNGTDTTAGVVIRNHLGHMVDGAFKKFKSSSVLQSELVAIRMACVMERDMGLYNVEIESDCKMGINLSVSELVPPWEVLSLSLDIQKLVRDLKLQFSWVPRSANKVVHLIASLASKGGLTPAWIRYPP